MGYRAGVDRRHPRSKVKMTFMRQFFISLWKDTRGLFALAVSGAKIVLPALPSLRGLFGDPLGVSKEKATAIVNQAERLMIDNRDEYLSGDASIQAQQGALAYFDQQFEYMRKALNANPAIAGSTASTSWRERDRGGVYDYPSRYRDPIADDPRLSAIERQTGQAIDTLSAGLGLPADGVMIALAGLGAFLAWQLLRRR